MEMVLSEEEKRALLVCARNAIARRLGLPIRSYDATFPDARCGAFVTLKSGGALRGCIGRMSSDDALEKTVGAMAAAAAFEDPRFPPLSRDEFDSVHIEISVLTPMEPSSREQVRVGTHGIYVRRGIRAGVLLPQVPVEYGWDRETFLAHGCRKAGLPPDAWKHDDTEILTFTAFVFGE
jgi:AmmeMemoRadiSam system protein A